MKWHPGSWLRWGVTPIITLTMVVVIIGFISVLTILDIRRTEAIYWRELEVRGLLLADGINELVADAIYFRRLEEMNKVADTIGRQADVAYVQIFTPDGRVLVDTNAAKYPIGIVVEELGQRALKGSQSLAERNHRTMKIAKPIITGNELLGGVSLGLGDEALRAEINGIIIEHIWQGLALIAAGVGVSYLIARRFTRPIRRLVTATERMASGRLDTRVEGVVGGELGELAGSFNRMAQELQAKVEALQESRSRIVLVQEGVRQEIAAHLHGRVQGRLLALKGRLQQVLGENDHWPQAAQTVGEVAEHLGQISQEEISALSRRLYPAILRRGLVPALQSLGDQFESALAVEMQLDEALMQQERANRNLIGEPVRLAGYRIAEEALTNVLKHAQASKVTIRLGMPGEGELCLMVRDDGRGFEMEGAAGGLGMAAVQDYAGAVGGRCVVSSAPGQGTEVTATLPLAAPGAEPVGKASP